MTIRLRKLIGTVVLLAFIIVYSLSAMVYTTTHLEGASLLEQTVVYAIAGLLWVIPAAILVKWMQRPDPDT